MHSVNLGIFHTVPRIHLGDLVNVFLFPQELVRLCGAQERELRRAGGRGEPPGARGGPLPVLPARLPATSDVSIPGGAKRGRGWRAEGARLGSEGGREAEMVKVTGESGPAEKK